MDAPAPTPTTELQRAIDGRQWYHSIELAPGLVTPGWMDCRGVASEVLPDCAGKRCLDIGTFDGFWAFEMERRGAAQVVAIDILDDARWDWPANTRPATRAAIAERKGSGDGFLIAAEQLGSRVERQDLSVYELDPDAHGRFDVVYMGSLLLHLRDPVGALMRVREVCAGSLAIADAVSLPLSAFPTSLSRLSADGRPYWWKPNLRALRKMVDAAGFELLRGPDFFLMPAGEGLPPMPIDSRTLRDREGRELIFASRFGDPHARLLARPAPGR